LTFNILIHIFSSVLILALYLKIRKLNWQSGQIVARNMEFRKEIVRLQVELEKSFGKIIELEKQK